MRSGHVYVRRHDRQHQHHHLGHATPAAWFSLGLASARGRIALPTQPDVSAVAVAVAVAVDSDAVLDHLRTSLTCGEDVLAHSESGVIRRFQGRAGSFRYTTVELVDVGAGSVTFEHLRGPFLACAETIEVQPTAHGCRLSTRVASRCAAGSPGFGHTLILDADGLRRVMGSEPLP